MIESLRSQRKLITMTKESTLPQHHHIGRSWTGHHLEDECECPQEACGLVNMDNAFAACPQHGWEAAKTMRQIHLADNCPALIKS